MGIHSQNFSTLRKEILNTLIPIKAQGPVENECIKSLLEDKELSQSHYDK